MAREHHTLEILDSRRSSGISQSSFREYPERASARELEAILSDMIASVHSEPVVARFTKKSFTTPKLVIFDLDSTLVSAEFMVYIGEKELEDNNRRDGLLTLTQAALRGLGEWELNYRERVKLLKGMKVEQLRDYYQELPLSEGAKELMTMLRGNDVPTAIVSGAWVRYVQHIADLLLIDECTGSVWGESNGRLTGEIIGEPIGPEHKVRVMDNLAQMYGVSTDEIVVIADGYNDLPMMMQAGCSFLLFTSQTPSPSFEAVQASLRLDFLTT